MTVRIHITPGLFPRQRTSVAWDVDASDLESCLDSIEKQFPGARRSLIDERGRIRSQIRLYVEGEITQSPNVALRGDESIVIETAQAAALARGYAVSRFKRRTDADLDYERQYGPIKMEGGCSGGLGESIAFAGLGSVLLVWVVGSTAFGGASVGLALILGGVGGTGLLAWGLHNLYDDLFA